MRCAVACKQMSSLVSSGSVTFSVEVLNRMVQHLCSGDWMLTFESAPSCPLYYELGCTRDGNITGHEFDISCQIFGRSVGAALEGSFNPALQITLESITDV